MTDQHPNYIRPANLEDAKFLVHLQRRYSDNLGFLPIPALEERLRAGNVLLSTQNDDQAGFLLWRPLLRHDPRACPILQAAVAMDAQRRHHGIALVNALADRAVLWGAKMLQCWAAADLPDLPFWQAAGFQEIARRPGGNRRGRELILYRRPLCPSVDIFRILPDPRHRSPGGAFTAPADPHQLTLFPTAENALGRR